MKIHIQIEDATPDQLRAIAWATSPLQKSNVVVQKSKEAVQKSNEEKQKPVKESKKVYRKWSKKAIRLANTKTPEAPYGLRLDGTPRKPTGPLKAKEQS